MGIGRGFPTYRLSTDTIPMAARGDACREFFASAIGLEFRPDAGMPPSVRSAITELPEIQVGMSQFSGFRIGRTAAGIGADGRADYAFTVVTRGACHATQLGKRATLRSGSAMLKTAGEPAMVDYTQGAQSVVLTPSRRALTALVPDADDRLAEPIEDSEALRLLTSYAMTIHREKSIGSALGAAAAAHLIDLTALALGAGRETAALAGGGGVRAARLAAVKSDIERHLADPQLTLRAVAARHGISPRYIGKLFAQEGTSFTDHVRDRRLERVRRALADARQAGHRIAAIAYDSGFGDLSYFNRCFRRRYGITPRDYRATHTSAQIPGG